MNKKTLKALKACIAKYQGYYDTVKTCGFVVTRENMGDIGISLYANNCALCGLYHWLECDGCPIAENGNRYCSGTPYYEIVGMLHKTTTGKKRKSNIKLLRHLKAEVEFLKSLLPVGEA